MTTTDGDAPSGVQTSDMMDAIFGDPFSSLTRRSGKSLSVSSFTLILAWVFNLKITKSPWPPVELEITNPQIIQVILVIVCLGFLLRYVLAFLPDYYREKERRKMVQSFLLSQQLKTAHEHASEDDDQIYHGEEEGMDPDPWWEDYIEMLQRIDPELKQLRPFAGKQVHLQLLRSVRVYGEGVFPIGITIVAIGLNCL